MRQDEYFLSSIGFDTAKNELAKVSMKWDIDQISPYSEVDRPSK